MMQQTKLSLLAALAVLSAATGWSLSQLWPTWFSQGLSVPIGSAVTMILVAVTLLVWTLMTRARLDPESSAKRMHPLVAARTAALAMSASRVGALALGFYFGVMLSNIVGTESPAASDRIKTCAVTAIASFVTVLVALWLERICRIEEPPAGSDLQNGSPA
ncbi:MAG: DUF3180 domain-containing protein [Actinomycetes bacterium]|jgi:hypothetical protein